MENIADVKIGLVTVSRNCFPKSLSEKRRTAVINESENIGLNIFEIKTIIEDEKDVIKAISEIDKTDINALVVYLGNFGPEGPETLIAQKFNGPIMFVAAAEESKNNLIDGRGDAFCGMLNASYNLSMRNLKVYIPQYPVGLADEVVKMIVEFENIARVLIGVKKLKIFSFGPRPYDFVACNAPIKPLYDLGVEIQENSELDLFVSFNKHENDGRIKEVVKNMEDELGSANNHSSILNKLAQYEVTLLDWIENNKGASEYFAFANKCWPAFQTQFGFVPCYVNSRFTSKGIPIACETDIYGALTEYIIASATKIPPSLLDINNTVPKDLYKDNIELFKNYKLNDLFMGFHCGNTSICYLENPQMKHQLIMKRSLEPDTKPNITRGTLEGKIKSGEITLFRLQSTSNCELKSYIAEGEILNADPMSFGSIGIFAVNEMARFYRYILIDKQYPHHAGIAFKYIGKILFESMKLMGIEDISYNQPKEILYKSENPFK